MALLSDIFGGGAVAGVVGKAMDVFGKFIPDTNAQAAAKIELEKMLDTQEFSLLQGQIEVNKIEAASPLTFVSAARPACMWVCVLGLAYQYLAFPFLVWGSSNWGWVSPPALNIEMLNTLLFGMLGLTVARTAEKLKGVARS